MGEANRQTGQDSARLKVIATCGPAIESTDSINNLVRLGIDGFRLNFATMLQEDAKNNISLIRKITKDMDRETAIIQDLRSLDVRLGRFDGVISVKRGQEIGLSTEETDERGLVLPVEPNLADIVKRGERLLFSGKVRGIITSVRSGVVSVKIDQPGLLVRGKRLYLPDSDFGGKLLTQKDRRDIVFGSEQDIDYIMIGGVQAASDLNALKRLLSNLGSKAGILIKLQTLRSVENLAEIVRACDGVVVDRSSLAIELSPELVPVIQARAAKLCQGSGKLCLVAAELMGSMLEQPSPTSAEVADLAAMSRSQIDAVVLDKETAFGRYPIEVVETMQKVIVTSQDSLDDQVASSKSVTSIGQVVNLAEEMGAKAVVIEVNSAQDIARVSTLMEKLPIIMVARNRRLLRKASIAYGSIPFLTNSKPDDSQSLVRWLSDSKMFKQGEKIALIHNSKSDQSLDGVNFHTF